MGRFNPAHLDRLLSEERRKSLPPESMLAELDIQHMHTVADIGCGPGYFTLPAAQMTKANVYGVDVSPEMLAYLMGRAKAEGVQNISAVESSAERINLPDQSVDRLLCSFVLHEVDDVSRVFGEFRRILKSGGKMLILEWEKRDTGSGPPVHERIDAQTLSEQLKAIGWEDRHIQPNPDQYAFLVDVMPGEAKA